MMVSHGDKTATGVLLKGVDPERMPQVLDLPRYIRVARSRATAARGRAPSRAGDLPRYLAPSGPRFQRTARLRTSAPPDGVGSAPSRARSPTQRDNAGRNVALLRAIEESLHQATEDFRRRSHGPEATDARRSGRPKAPERPLPAGRPARLDRTRTGGYKSELPATTTPPDDVAPDPCASPSSVTRMPGIVVGEHARPQTLNLHLGDCLQVTSPTIGYSVLRGTIRPPIAKQFRVIAMFEAGFDQYDSKLVYTDLYEAQAFYEQGDTVTGVEMKVDDIDKARAHREARSTQALANGLYHTMDWEELNHGLFTALRIQQIAMSVVLALIIVVAAFTVIATLIMVVLDKKKEIAVLKAMGASRRRILRIFLYQGGFIGGCGTALGLGLGVAGVQRAAWSTASPSIPRCISSRGCR